MPTESETCVAVIDDDASVCRALARLLRASGLHAVTYASAEEFLDDQNRLAFDCLIVDVQLAELSGIDLQQRLASRGGVPPTIFITANDDAATRERAERLGCVAYLRKTAPGHELLRLIRSVLPRSAPPREANAGEP